MKRNLKILLISSIILIALIIVVIKLFVKISDKDADKTAENILTNKIEEETGLSIKAEEGLSEKYLVEPEKPEKIVE